jgi:hypothetical protein
MSRGSDKNAGLRIIQRPESDGRATAIHFYLEKFRMNKFRDGAPRRKQRAAHLDCARIIILGAIARTPRAYYLFPAMLLHLPARLFTATAKGNKRRTMMRFRAFNFYYLWRISFVG